MSAPVSTHVSAPVSTHVSAHVRTHVVSEYTCESTCISARTCLLCCVHDITMRYVIGA